MNILFMSLSDYDSIYTSGLYSDLLRQFISNGDKVFLICPVERRKCIEEKIIYENNAMIIKVKILNIQKANIIEKCISMFTIDSIFINAIRRHFFNIRFDLILYPTPPITLLRAVEYVKKRDSAKAYLLLKDIFPQNAVDIGLMSVKGLRGLIYRYFRTQEKKLYSISDYIGCMSKGNVNYITEHNPSIDKRIVKVCPNSIDPVDKSCTYDDRIKIRKKYKIPLERMVFVYGGNLGKPQGIPFLLDCLANQRNNEKVFFLIIGAGTEYKRIDSYIKDRKIQNARLLSRMQRDEYDVMISSCDVGLIYLDHRFTIPNFPSRILSYMQAKLPVYACTDTSSDLCEAIKDGDFGWWTESNSIEDFNGTIECIINDRELKKKGINGYNYLVNNYSSRVSYEIIKNQLSNLCME